MQPRTFTPTFRFRSVLALSMIAVLLAACAPTAATKAPNANPPPQQAATQAPESQPVQPQATEEPAQQDPAPVAAATSRGDALQATDPKTVSLASGEIQLIEFFRFT